MAAAISVTPMTCNDTIIDAARIKEKIASIKEALVPYTLADSGSKVTNKSCL